MALRFGYFLLAVLSFIARAYPTIAERIVVDDVNPSLVYSNSGPSWWAANSYNGQGRLVGGHSITNPGITPYLMTWHESLGDGAFVSLQFTGTSISLVGTICNTGYNTTVEFFIDGQHVSSFEHRVPGPQHDNVINKGYNSDVQIQYILGDFPNLSPAEHTFKAVSVGGDSLFVVDYIAYEASEATPVSSSSVSLDSVLHSSGAPTTSGSIGIGSASSTTKASGIAITTLTSSSISGSASSQSTASTALDGSQPVVAEMDVPASDPRIVYSPPEAWSQYGSTRRAMSCLDGTMASSATNSSLTYKFTGTAIQLYTITSLLGGNYSLSLDGQDQGLYSSYDPSRDLLMCSSRPLYSATGLANGLHTLVLTVREHPLGSSQGTIQFVGFRTSSTGIHSSEDASVAGPNIAPIVGGILGGLCGIAFLTLLVLWWMRRQRQKEDALLSSILDPPSPPSLESETWAPYHSGKIPVSTQPHWTAGSSPSMVSQLSPTMPPYMETTYHDIESIEPSSREQDSIQSPEATGQFDSAIGRQPSSMPQRAQTTAHISQHPDDVATDSLTYSTLPSYHENVMRRAAARNLSQADIDAISRRLTEVIRNQMEQNGANPNDLSGMMPPQELIDHLIEERQPSSSSGPQKGAESY